MNWILAWIFKAIISSLDTITWKKSIDLNKVSKNVFTLIWTLWGVFFTAIFLIIGSAKIDAVFSYIFLIMLFVNFLGTVALNIEQKVYRNEKLSVLAPYSNLDTILVIIISFFIFSWQSVISFLMAILSTIVIIIASIDFKNIALPRNFLGLVISKWIWAGKSILVWILLKQVDSYNFYVINNLSYVLVNVFLVLFISRDLFTIKKSTKQFLWYRLISNFFGNISSIVSFLLIANLGLIITNLLGFLTLTTTLIFSYILFWDKPTKKNIIVTITISILIWIWIYYK